MELAPTSLRLRLTTCALAALALGCSPDQSGERQESVGGTAAAGKIPVTSSSEEAQRLFAEGRQLRENLRAHDGRQRLLEAAAKDSGFAMVHYELALASPTAKEFFEHLNRAVALSEKASEGERLMILSLESGSNADPAKALQYAEQLVTRHPQDQRAQVILANAYSGEQQFEKAVGHLTKAVEIAPDYAPAYNTLGYTYRPLERYAEAEEAFKKYIELIPNDPNPYDSYAELLMKTGRFDESITQYRKALAVDSNFAPSRVGIASDLMLQGKHAEAVAEAQKLFDRARNDGERRTAMFTQAVIYVDQGKTDQALKAVEKQFAVAAKIGDTAAMAGDVISMGDILLEAGRTDQAAKRYQQALDLTMKSNLSQDLKDDAELAHHYNLARVELKKHNAAGARKHGDAYLSGATTRRNDFRTRQAHELMGHISIEEKKYDEALTHLGRATQQNPYVVYATAVAYKGSGNGEKAAETFKKAADFNILPTFNYAFVRAKAKKAAGSA